MNYLNFIRGTFFTLGAILLTLLLLGIVLAIIEGIRDSLDSYKYAKELEKQRDINEKAKEMLIEMRITKQIESAEKEFKITPDLAKNLIAGNKKYLGEDLYYKILSDPRDYSHEWFKKLERIANESSGDSSDAGEDSSVAR